MTCNGTCVDTATDRNNCGGCGNICSDKQLCDAGSCTNRQHLAIPSYFYPDSGSTNPLSNWDQMGNAAPTVGLVIINPSNGPGESQNSDYQEQVKNSDDDGLHVLGYVRTAYGTRCLDCVKADIDVYYQWYDVAMDSSPNHLDGIFFDEVSTDCADFAYYKSLHDYVKVKGGAALVALNPGTATSECYMQVADIIATFEGPYTNYVNYTPKGWETSYLPDRFWHIVYNVTTPGALQDAITKSRDWGAGWLYITDTSSYSVLPTCPYWMHELNEIGSPQQCSNGADCCSSTCDSSGHCACAIAGDTCTEDANCCLGTCCMTSGPHQGTCWSGSECGDTHVITFKGLMYDFQASGDFVLAQHGPDFVVQTRKLSGAPRWPDASINAAVAMRVGRTQVAICLGETRLHVDGQPTPLNDGQALSLPDGVAVSRQGDTYVIKGQSGDAVSATIRSNTQREWINVFVGFAGSPAKVSGLLGNANGNVNAIEASDGTVFTSPFSFDDLYHHYADSWRVKPDESLLTVCGEEKERGIPTKPLYAKDLDPRLADPARAVCTAAGVQAGPLFEACVLDVVVLHDESATDESAAQVYVGMPAPIVEGIVVPSEAD